MPTVIVLVQLKSGVEPADYERWVMEGYAPAVRELPSVSDWRNHRVNNLLGSEEDPPHEYVVTLEVENLARLREDMAGGRMRALISELHGYAGVTQLVAERFA